MKMTNTLAAIVTATLLSTSVSAAQFYKWTDEQGVTHYSEAPPPSSVGKASEVKVRTKLPSGAKEILDNQQKIVDDKSKNNALGKDKAVGKKNDDKTAPSTAAATPDQKTPEQYAEKCKMLRENLETLQTRGRIREANADGSVRALPDEEKQQRLDETQRQIKAFCEG